MKKQVYRGLTALLVMAATMSYGQSYDNNNNRQNDNRNYDSRSSRSEDERNYQNNDSRNNDQSDRSYQNNDSRYNDRRNDDRNQDAYRSDNRGGRQYQDRDLQQAYDKGYDDGMNDGQRNANDNQKSKSKEKGKYQSFAFGLYGGLNATYLAGETVSTSNPQGRLGYQFGGYVRGGGRLFGQIGVEYMTSSSNIVTKGDGTLKNPGDLINGVDQRYIHIPAYVGVKLAQSNRGISAIRLQVGAELATVTSNTTDVTLNNSSVNGLANLGFDAGPLTIDFVYHYGFNNTIQNLMVNYKPRILGVNVGFKF